MGIKLAYGIRDGELVLISEIKPEERGLRCSCICPVCKKALIAKLGNKRKHHFAHAFNNNCNIRRAQETGLHAFAKKIIEKNLSILLPSWSIDRKDVMEDSENMVIAKEIGIDKPITEEAHFCNYSSVVLESHLGSIKPDVLLSFNGKLCAVEIHVTHRVDETKENKVISMGLPMFEIDLRDLIQIIPTEEEIIQAVLKQETNRKWIYNPKRENRLIDLRNAFHLAQERHKHDITNDRLSVQASYKKKENNAPQEYEEQNVTIIEDNNNDNDREIDFSLDINSIPLTDQNNAKALQNSIQAKAQLSSRLFSKHILDYPFFMNIPITGEAVFCCDRRIWQGQIFDEFVYNRNSAWYSVKEIESFITSKMKSLLNERKRYHSISDRDEFDVLKKVIKKYFQYLSLLGFIEWKEYYGRTIRSHSVSPPNSDTAKALETIINIVDQFDPNVDYEIARRLQGLR